MRSLHFQVAVGATADAAATVTIPVTTFILGVTWHLMYTAGNIVAGPEYVYGQIGLSSVYQTASDFQGILSEFGGVTALSTNGAIAAGFSGGVMGISCPMKAGEKVYVNVVESGALTWLVRGLIWIRD